MLRSKAKRLFSSALIDSRLVHSARTGIGTAASLALTRLLGMPEAYWAPITTLIVMQSTIGAAWGASKPRFIGTALGATSGGLLASYFEPGIIVFGAAIFALGLICEILHLDQSAYRFAASRSRLSCSWGEEDRHGSSEFTVSSRSHWESRSLLPLPRSGQGVNWQTARTHRKTGSVSR